MVDSVFLAARAAVLADLQARRRASAHAVSALEDALEQRRWWADQWPEGTVYVAGLVAQDVQDALFEEVGRWPLCLAAGGRPRAPALHPAGPGRTGPGVGLRGERDGRGRAGAAQLSWPSCTQSVNRSAR